MQSTYPSKKVYPYPSNKGYPILQKAKDNNINIRIDKLFDYIIRILNNENLEKLKIIIYCIKEIFKSNKKKLLLRATRESLISVYDNCKEFEYSYKNTEKEINNFFEYYYASVIKKLEI